MKKGTVRKNGVRVDGKEVECLRKEGETWADALDRTLSGIAGERAVLGVLLNGTPGSRADIEGLSDGGSWIVEVQTQGHGDLLREVLSDLVGHLDSLMMVFQEIGHNLRRGNLAGVFGSPSTDAPTGGVYMQGLEGIVAAQVLVEEVGRIERQSGADSFRISFIEEKDRIETILSGMLRSQETQDWVLLADLVEYEVLPILQRGRIRSSRMLSQVAQPETKENLVVA